MSDIVSKTDLSSSSLQISKLAVLSKTPSFASSMILITAAAANGVKEACFSMTGVNLSMKSARVSDHA